MVYSLIDDNLDYAWQSCRGNIYTDTANTRILCQGVVHDGVEDCLLKFLGKLVDTGRVASKFYILLHAIPLLLKLRKAKDWRSVLKMIASSSYYYARSVFFMSFLVALLRGAMCCTNHCAASPTLSSHHVI